MDRVGNGWATVVCGGAQFAVPLDLLPPGTKAGDWLRAAFESAPDLREAAQRRVEELQRDVYGH